MKPNNHISKVSQKAIALHLGVSQALVSMVLNGKNDRIGTETYQRIWDYALSIGYRPKGMSLDHGQRSASPTLIGFILRARLMLHTQSNFYSHVQQGLHDYLEKAGHSIVFLGTEGSILDNEFRGLEAYRRRLHGIVVMGEVEVTFLERLKKIFPKLVSVSACFPGLCHSVRNNELKSIELILEHLWSSGHRSFAWLGGNFKLGPHTQRLTAFHRTLAKLGASCPEDRVVMVRGGDRMDGRESARILLERFQGSSIPSAWIAYNGLMARGAVNQLAARGINVPNDISVAAVDATRTCVDEEPALTSASANPEEMGRTAGRLLIQATGDAMETFHDLVLPPELAIRQSTGKAPVDEKPAHSPLITAGC